MKIYNLRRFSKPEFLRYVAPKLLLAFLHRFPEFGIGLKDNGTVDYDKLGRQLASPTGKINTRMFDALALIDEMSADRNFDLLQDVVGDKPYSAKLGDDVSAADLALLLWLNEPKKLEQLHAKFSSKVPRSFIYFYGESIKKQQMAPPSRNLRQKLARLLNRIFQRKRRGRTIRIVVFEEPDEYCFLLRKGEPLTRDSSITPEGKTNNIYYRPERFDIVILRPKISEIRLAIYRKAPWIVEAYRSIFGYVFYGDREFFSGDDVFTLEPLVKDSEKALECKEIEGMESVTLVQCKFATAKGEIAAIHGDLAMQVISGLKLKLLENAKIISAKFRVKFTDSKAVRMVKIKAGNLAEFKYDDDGRKIEEWLIKRGFKHEQRQ
ncbi:MAG: hypothetical protein PHH77_02125 [Victivallaceae bacterium]|nr:hypothetical protein [Victivallaceae bacterium]